MKPPVAHAPEAEGAEGSIPLPLSVKQNIKDGVVALTMAVWCFLRPWAHLLFDENRYFHKLPVTRVNLLALMVNIWGLALILWLGIAVWRRTRSNVLAVTLAVLFLGLLVFPLDYLRVQFFGLTTIGLGGVLRYPATVPGLIVLLFLFIWKHRPITRVVTAILCVTFPAALWTVVKLALLFLGVMEFRQCAAATPPPPLLPAREGQPRVLWIIFDETDYRLAFEKRPPGVALPEFDRLRKESLFATAAYPPGGATLISMPALITGHRLTAVAHDDCDLALTRADTGTTTDWSASPTIFSDARALGVNTALVGWYHPYGRLLGGSLNYCSWYPFPAFEQARATTFVESILEQIADLSGHFHVRARFSQACQESLKDSLTVVTNAGYGLTLLHLPPPHLPGVFLPATGEFTCMGIRLPAGYFNNLVLADREFGGLRNEMEAAGMWDKTWVILSADHWWRTSETYDGTSDHRVPFLVKSPGISNFTIYSRQFNTILTHDLILSILRGQVTNLAGVATMLDTGKPDMPVPWLGEGAE